MPEGTRGPAEFVCFEVIRQLEAGNHDVPETNFNKYCALVYDELKERELADEVKLPLYWYQYGYVVHRREMYLAFSRRRKKFDQHSGYVISLRDMENLAFDVSADLKNQIQTATKSVLERIGYVNPTKDLIDIAYAAQAPEEFIESMNQFRHNLENLTDDIADQDEYVQGVGVSWQDATKTDDSKREKVCIADEERENLYDGLNDLVGKYPDRYSKMRPHFLKWQSISRQLIENGQLSQLRRFQSEFWNTMSRVEFRLKHNENMSYRFLQMWRQDVDEELEEFSKEIQRYRDAAMEYREDTEWLRILAEPYSDAVQKKYEQMTDS